MSEQEWLCKEHKQPIVCFCLGYHKCSDRRLCLDCLFSSHSDLPKFRVPKVNDLQKSLQEKLQEYQKRKPFDLLKFIKQLQDQINRIFQDIISSAELLISYSVVIDEDIVNIKDQLQTKSFLSFSEEDTEKMIQIMRDNLLDEKQEKQQYLRNQMENIHKQLEATVEECSQQLLKFTQYNKKEFIDEYVSIEGNTIMGLRQGEQYFCLADGRKKYAGWSEQGRKEGEWNVYCGQYNEYWEESYVGWQQHRQNLFKIKKFNRGIEQLDIISTDQDGFQVLRETIGNKQNIHFKGQGKNSQRKGLWQYIHEGKVIGGGEFNENSQKVGKWVECHENYWDQCQVIYSGEYVNGLRVGQWTIQYQNKKIGGGNYDIKGKKSGNWIDVHENFWDRCQVVFSGEYKNGIRVGQWNTQHKNKKIGGGIYDDKGEKQGNWIDIHQNYWELVLVVHSGAYRNGIRYGQWTSQFQSKKGGGGNYDDRGRKQGIWVELHENFYSQFEVFYSGEYRNGQRFGQWSIYYLFEKLYNKYYTLVLGIMMLTETRQGNGQNYMKTLISNYCNKLRYCQVYSQGKYVNGVQIDEWITFYQGSYLGGGKYDQNGVKQGPWIDLEANFTCFNKIAFKGQYIDGLRSGTWYIKFIDDGDKIQKFTNYNSKGNIIS